MTKNKTTAIFRYEIKGNKSTIAMPAGAVVLSVLPRQGRLDLYALVDTTAKPTDRHFVAVKTGELQSDALWDASHLFSLPGVHLFETQHAASF